MSNEKHTNALIHESSPYLLQHAHNPVDWQPWTEEVLDAAQESGKPLLISIGYSACHWCHVMEHESFEDEAVAAYMNEHFVCIKVDREERPDVDQVYMDAVQLMTGRGGWPLNCFATPDGRPFYGGTYFPKVQWMSVMQQLSELYRTERSKVEAYANKLKDGLDRMNRPPLVAVQNEFDNQAVESAVTRWKSMLDSSHGGTGDAPKFPMPNNIDFLMAYTEINGDASLKKSIHLWLTNMAKGGIYDQLGGGFARYSTDEIWKVPHFEKMLYDNGQLLKTYSRAYQWSEDPLYLKIIEGTAKWIEREMTDEFGGFMSALDADSEGVEGKYYTWTLPELTSMAGEQFDIISDYFQINERGLWEDGRYILMVTEDVDRLLEKHQISAAQLNSTVEQFTKDAMNMRSQRVPPGMDDKRICSWNAMCSEGLIWASRATGNKAYGDMARKNLDFIDRFMRQKNGALWHTYKNGQGTINAYLDDYAHLISALLSMYELRFDVRDLNRARSLADEVIQHFDRNDAGMFYYKSNRDTALVAQKAEIHDNVIPASNSVMAMNLFKLGRYFGDAGYREMCDQMLSQVVPGFESYPTGHSQWMTLHLCYTAPLREVVVIGKNCWQKIEAFHRKFLPMTVLCASENEIEVPIAADKMVDGKTLIYVCEHGACKRPVEQVSEALGNLRPGSTNT